MMTTNKTFRFQRILIFMIILCSAHPCFCEDGNWTVAAQKFAYAKGQNQNAVTSATAEMLPANILEKLSRAIKRNVMPDENLDRAKYKLRTERQSLYLQLSSEYKKRDSLILSNFSDLKLKSAIKEQEKKIAEIQKKIDENLAKLKEESDLAEMQMNELAQGLGGPVKTEDNELERFRNLFKKIFLKNESYITQENIVFYNNDYTSLFQPNGEALEFGTESAAYEKQVVSSNINTVLTGLITQYGDYVSVSADLYVYPGAKKIGSVTEVGNIQEYDLLTSAIAMQLLPSLTNALPVEITFIVGPESAAGGCEIYVDDALQKTETGKVILDSGVHKVQFISEGFRTAGTSYYFEGNKKYLIEVNLAEKKDGFIQIGLRNELTGDFYLNGEKADKVNDKKSQISINGNAILGEFISEDGNTAYIYVPENKVYDGNYVTVKPKPMDRMSYIDTRRKWMYASYSLLIISLIPMFYTYSNYLNYVNLYNNNQIDYETGKKWQNATNITRWVSIGCGVLWGYEFVRYLLAANKVLPEYAKNGNPAEFEKFEPLVQKQNINDENSKSEETADEKIVQ